jgi:predicted  nucleic acid-binding Zn-ribbon protein
LDKLKAELATLEGKISAEKVTNEQENPSRTENVQKLTQEQQALEERKTTIEKQLKKIKKDKERIDQPRTLTASAYHWFEDTLGL